MKGAKIYVHHGASDLAKILVDVTDGCEVQSQRLRKKLNSGSREQVSQVVDLGFKKNPIALFGAFWCLACASRGAFALEPTSMMNQPLRSPFV